MRTFRDVKRHFAEIFRELVPQGRGEIVLQTSLPLPPSVAQRRSESGDGEKGSDDEHEFDDKGKENDQSKAYIDVSIYNGIGVSVSFVGRVEGVDGLGGETEKGGREDEVKNMRELSGGQKALVALAIIFAIQRCDPAPFYLFDEIDQGT